MKYRIVSLLLILSLSVLYGIHAQVQYPLPSGMYPTASTDSYPDAALSAASYSEYFTMPTGPVPVAHTTAPQNYDIQAQQPETVYSGGRELGVPYSQYLASNWGGSSLWIQGKTSWTQRVVVPQGAFLSLIAISAREGYGYLHETYPDGRLVKNYYYFYPVSRVGYSADSIGQHILLFLTDDQVSNAIIIDVVGSYPPGYQQPSYVQPSYVEPSYVQPSYVQPSYVQPSYYWPPSYPRYMLPFYFPYNRWHHIDNISPYIH